MKYIVIDNVNRTLKRNFTYFELDQFYCGYTECDWNNESGNPVGCGKWRSDNLLALMRGVRSLVASEGKTGNFSFITEEPVEMLVPFTQGFLMRDGNMDYSATTNNSYRVGIPLFSYLYNQYYVGNGLTISSYLTNATTPPSSTSPDQMYAFAMQIMAGSIPTSYATPNNNDAFWYPFNYSQGTYSNTINMTRLGIFQKWLKYTDKQTRLSEIMHPPNVYGLPPDKTTSVTSWSTNLVTNNVYSPILRNVFKLANDSLDYHFISIYAGTANLTVEVGKYDTNLTSFSIWRKVNGNSVLVNASASGTVNVSLNLSENDVATIMLRPATYCACGEITIPGYACNLGSDLSPSGTCFNVTAQNVSINCAGHSITGGNASGSYGVYSNQANTTVRNCGISNFARGAYFTGASSLALNNTVNITYDDADSNTSGIFASGSNSLVLNNTATAVHYAVLLASGNNITASGNTLTATSWHGLTLAGATSAQVYNNTITGGIPVSSWSGASGANITRNRLAGSSGSYGMYLIGISNSVICNNTFTGQTAPTLFINSSAGNNTFYWNNFTSATGLYVNDSNGTNHYNTTLSGHGEGNIWDNVINGSVQVNGPVASLFGSGLYVGSSGSGYPYNDTTSGGMFLCSFAGCADAAPLTLNSSASELGNLTVLAGAGGAADGNATNFAVPANRSINATAATNYTFANWTSAGNCTVANNTSSTTVEVRSGWCNVTANFAAVANDTITLKLNNTEANFTAAYGTSLTVNATSASGTHALYRNGSLISSNYTATLAAGYYNFTANSTGNANYTAASKTYFANISKAPSTANITANSWAISSGQNATVNCTISNSQSNLSLYQNGTYLNSSTGNFSTLVQSLATGTYNFTCNATASENYSASNSASNILTVGQLADTITLLMNGSQANFTAAYGTSLTVNATSASGTHALYRNGSLISSNYTATLAAGYYNFTANSTGNANYTAASKTYFANISKAPSTANITANSWAISSGQNATVNCTISNSQSNLSLYQNGTYLNSSTGNFSTLVQSLATGTYNFTCNASSSENYTASSGQSHLLQVISTPPSIISASVSPNTTANGSSVSLYINATGADSTWANVSLPDGSAELVALANDANTTYSNTSLPGTYNITFHANNSMGNASSTGSFEAYSQIAFNATLVDHNQSGLNSTFFAYYQDTLVASNSSPNGTFTEQLPYGLVDLRFSAYSGRISALLRSVNASADNNRTLGMDRNSSLSGYLVSYGMNSSYNFTNATVSIYYDDAAYASEAALLLYKCDNYTFASLACNGIWSNATANATQNTSGHYFSLPAYSFSGFAVRQGPYCGDGVCSSGKTCASCPSDCGICPSGGGSGGGGGGGGGGGSSSASLKQSSTFMVDLGYGKFCPVRITREMGSTANLSVLTTTLENIGNESCGMEDFTFSDTIPPVFSAMDNLTFVPAYDSRNGSSVNFTFPSFSSGESKTFTYSAKTWIPPSRAKNFTVYDMVAKKQAAPPEAEPPKPAQPAETPVELPPVAPQVKQPSKQPAPSAPKAIIYGKPDDTLPFALAALALATACALIVYYFTRGKDGKQGPAAPPGRPPGA